MRLRHRATTFAGTACALTATIMLLGGCSSNDSGDASAQNTAVPTVSAADSSAETTDSSRTDATKSAQFEKCMSDNGVTMPDRGQAGSPPAGGGAPSGAPSGGEPPSGVAPSGAPTGAPAGGTEQAPPGVDADTWKKAVKACASYAPTRSGTD
ncbi:MAG: hypothetical protein QM809_08955 [Gordonia sp. (in: high G+C Gram-positive bacteria)]|uniref:hypothetical protein n=1 Tax=Gordonia sp. (in: high G+C Gram-positive bacteria) TaxID=84139 RepID=UPI0039E6DE67